MSCVPIWVLYFLESLIFSNEDSYLKICYNLTILSEGCSTRSQRHFHSLLYMHTSVPDTVR